jgi:signal peptidase
MRSTSPRHAAARRGVGRRMLGAVVNLALAGCLLLFLLLGVGPHVLGYRTATMLTGSMEPGISPGDVVITVPKPAAELAVGDVISYHIPIEDQRVETHRVTKVVHAADGTTTFRTKGDNNPGVDPWTATLQGDTVWEERAVVPGLGNAIRMLRSPAVQHGVFWVAVAGLILLGLTLIWGSSDEADEDDDADDSDDSDDAERDHSDRASGAEPPGSEHGLAA